MVSFGWQEKKKERITNIISDLFGENRWTRSMEHHNPCHQEYLHNLVANT